MSNIEKIIGGIATLALIVALSVAVFGGGTTVIDRTITKTTKTFGGITNFDSLTLGEDLVVTGASDVSTFTQGGGIRATSTDDTSAALLASDFDVENIIDFTPNVVSITLTLPASSTLSSFAPTAGDSRTIKIRNATTTIGTSFTIASGTGNTFKSATTTRVIEANDDYVVLEFVRRSDTDFDVFLSVIN